jgi:uncharacterized membrane protein YccC
MFSLSTRTKEAIKTSLAMVIAFGLSLWMDWDRPYWAAFAVAFISLDTTGASLNKGAMRMLGTLVAILAAFTFLALFPQQRWLFVAAVSLYVGLCAYMMTGKKRQYFWYASGFICVVIAVHASNSLAAFQIAVERAQETGTGVLIYSLISMLIWPRGSQSAFEDTSHKLLESQARLYRTYQSLMSGKGTAKDSKPLEMQEVQLLTQVGQLLNAAETDSYEVWEVRHQWRHFHQLSTTLRETLDRWRESFPQIQEIDLAKPLPNIDSLREEIDLRFAEIGHMLAGRAPERLPQTIALRIDRTEIRTLSHFQKAAIAVFQAQIERLEALSRALFDCVRDLRGFGGSVPKSLEAKTHRRGLTIDPDRLQDVITVMATLWIGFLIWVYVDPPGHASFVLVPTVLTMVAVMVGISTTRMALPLILGTLFAGIVYVFVMPHLSGYGQLGMTIFIVTFGISYLFSAPRLAGVKLTALAMFVNNISVQNQQTYSFASFTNSLVMITLVAGFIIATAYIPTSPHPEKAFLRLLRRFFRQAEFMISQLALDRDQKKGWTVRWKMLFYHNDLLELPIKLATLAQQIDNRLLHDTTPGKIQVLVTNLQALAYQVQELTEARTIQQSKLLVRELITDVRAWRVAVQKIFGRLSEEPESIDSVSLRSKLDATLDRLEKRIEAALDKADETRVSDEEGKNIYRMLGAYRGVSEALVDFAKQTVEIDWARWREERF